MQQTWAFPGWCSNLYCNVPNLFLRGRDEVLFLFSETRNECNQHSYEDRIEGQLKKGGVHLLAVNQTMTPVM